MGTGYCVDSMQHKNGAGAFNLMWCHKQGGNQLFRLTENNQFSQFDQCVTVQSGMVTQVKCKGAQNREWTYDKVSF